MLSAKLIKFGIVRYEKLCAQVYQLKLGCLTLLRAGYGANERTFEGTCICVLSGKKFFNTKDSGSAEFSVIYVN